MFRSSTRSEYKFPLAIGLLFLSSSAVGATGPAVASPLQLDDSAATCQAENPDDADTKTGQADQEKAEEEDNDFFLWLDNAFSTSAGGQAKKPGGSTREGNDRDHGGGGGRGGGGGGGGNGGGGH